MSTHAPARAEGLARQAAWLNARSLRIVALATLLAAALVIRLLWIEAPGILVERDFASAVFARTFYLAHMPAAEPWRLAVAVSSRADLPALEPPVTDRLVSLIYQVAGHEDRRYARVLTSLFWVIGGYFFWKTTRYFLVPKAALLATGYYLFAPLGISTSRSFQPDALMMLLFMISLFLITAYFYRPALLTLVLAAAVSGLALLIKPQILFILFGTFGGLLLYFRGLTRRSAETCLIFALISLALPGVYYGYAIFGAGFMRWKLGASWRPDLYLQPFFWRNWFLIGVGAVGITPIVASFFGVPLLPRGPARMLFASLLAGYVVFGLVFNIHIHTHNYYHIQLIPAAAIGIAPLAPLLVDQLRRATPRFWMAPLLATALLVGGFAVRDARARLHSQFFESPQVASEIGEIVGHSDHTVFLARHYGIPLQYYGELAGAYWPRTITSPPYTRPGERALTVAERFAAIPWRPDYFIITDFAEFERHHADLRVFLDQNATLLARSDSYLIYTLQHVDWARALGRPSGRDLSGGKDVC